MKSVRELTLTITLNADDAVLIAHDINEIRKGISHGEFENRYPALDEFLGHLESMAGF